MLPALTAAGSMLSSGGGLSGGGQSDSSSMPIATGPVVVNIAGFGSKASGSASAGASSVPVGAQSQSYGGGDFAVAGALPSWAIPAAIGAVLLVLVVALRR